MQRKRSCPLYPRKRSKKRTSGPDGKQSILLCPVRSNVDLFRYGKGIVHIDAEVPHSALYLGVTEQKLHGSQIPSAPIDQCRLSSPQ